MQNETIVALSTPPGRSALALIRLSGAESLQVVARVLANGDADLERLEARTATLVQIHDPSAEGARRFIDTCMVTPFIGPRSYTGEDVVEISSHGGILVQELIVEALVEAGARLARPGEFTQRAFLNGKFDLAQAEAVESIVSARTQSELGLAHEHYSGQFSNEIQALRSEILDLLSLLELELDFAEEDVEFADRNALLDRLRRFRGLLDRLLRSYERSHIIRQGIQVAIVGRPNVGKSSLLNLLLKKERAIVTDIPGTTRDVLEEEVDIRGVKFVFIDTAGIHETEDIVEQEGIRRSESSLAAAAAVLFLVDSSCPLQKADWAIRQRILHARPHAQPQHNLLLVNKTDLPERLNKAETAGIAKGFGVTAISCNTGAGLEELETALLAVARELLGEGGNREPTLLNQRQKHAASAARDATDRALQHFDQNLSQEFVSAELRIALDELGSLIGEVTTEDILGNIFANFCIGK